MFTVPALSKGSTAYPRRLLSMFILLAVVSLSLVLCQLGRSQKVNFEGTPRERILRLLEEHPLIDSHNDLPEHIYGKFKNRIEGVNLSDLSSDFHTDWTRLRQGRLSVQIWSAYVPCTKVDIWSDAVPRTFEQMDLIKRMISAYPKDLQWAQSTRDIHSAFKSGRIASLIGIEGSHQVGDSVAVLRMAYDLGARYLTLTHTCHTGWADSCASPGPHGGLSKSGREAVLEMNRLGMMVDLSHVSREAMHAVLNLTTVPVIFSHSSAFSLCNNPRNVPDSVLTRIKETGGVVMVNFYPAFIKCGENDGKPATLNDVADHIDHIARVAGHEHVGIGSDFDGINSVPVGLEDVSKYPDLFVELLNRGWSDKNLIGLAGRNFLQVFKAVEDRAKKLQASQTISELPFSPVANRSC